MTSRFRRRLGSVGLAKGGSLLGVAVLATGLAARVVRTRLRPTSNEVAGPARAGGEPRRSGAGSGRAARRTVTPKAGGGWTVGGGRRSRKFRTQADAEHAARAELLTTGGGELVVRGKDGKVRDKTTVGKVDADKSVPNHKGPEPDKSPDAPKASDAQTAED